MYDCINKQLRDYFKKDLEAMIQDGFKLISNLGGFRCWDNTNFVKKIPMLLTLTFPSLESIYFLSSITITSFFKKIQSV